VHHRDRPVRPHRVAHPAHVGQPHGGIDRIPRMSATTPEPRQREADRSRVDARDHTGALGSDVQPHRRLREVSVGGRDPVAQALQRRIPHELLTVCDQGAGPLDELVAGVENGIMIDGDGSFSIDQQRFNAQFGGQVFREIRNGRVGGMLKDVAYQMRTPDFWNAMDMIGGKKSYLMGGSFFDGKGQPPQINAVSHGSPPARFRNINVINTGRKA